MIIVINYYVLCLTTELRFIYASQLNTRRKIPTKSGLTLAGYLLGISTLFLLTEYSLRLLFKKRAYK